VPSRRESLALGPR